MIEVSVNINRSLDIISVQAVRIYPTTRPPEEGEVCLYDLYIKEEKTGVTIGFPYGDGIALAAKMLESANKILGSGGYSNTDDVDWDWRIGLVEQDLIAIKALAEMQDIGGGSDENVLTAINILSRKLEELKKEIEEDK